MGGRSVLRSIPAGNGRWLFVVLIAALVAALGPHAPSAAARPAQWRGPAPAASPIDNGLVGYWPFDFNTGATDFSGSGNTMTFGNAMGGTSDVAPAHGTVQDNTGALLSSNNANSYASATGT